ncbi:MAG: T-complex protein 1 subunit theta [Chaenotheca gracillima]|nr:MAG: T-complex protein 1 subunit theta [Chaenotheca gracillima]
MSKQLYDQTLEQYRGRILPSYDPRARMVTRVLDRLIPKAGLTPEETEHTNWEIFVIDDPEQKNAFVIPGGKVFVFSGILPICRGEDGLAAVLGHEIAHNVAHHAAERISQAFLVFGVVQVIMFLYGAPDIFSRILFDTVFLKPGSRKQESEADYIGVLMMAKACYNPEAAVGLCGALENYFVDLWQRMAEAEQHAPPQWLSTHPSSANRMERIKGWLPEAEDKRKQGGCGSTSGFANDFRRTLTQNGDKHKANDKLTFTTRIFSNMLSEFYESEDGAVLRNIDACRTIAQTVQTSFGPYGRNKIVINHLQKMILTNDAATILRELEVVHPAAKLIVMASQQQEAEMGDATNLVIVLAGELLRKAEDLLRMGLKSSDIVQGYEKAQNFALQALEDLVVDKVNDLQSQDELSKAIRTVVAAKQSGNEDFLAELVAEAVLAVLPPKNPTNFNVDNVRVVKIMGGSLEQSRVVKGMVFGREPDGSVKKASKARVGVYSCPIDISQTETKGTVLLHNAKEMLDFTKGEESQLETIVKELYDSGLRVVVAGSTIGELAMHYLNRYGILVIKILSKFELRRLCRVVGATPLARLGAPMPDEMGKVDVVETLEIGGDRVTVFRQENETTKTATLVIRGATQNHLDDIERAIDDGVNVIKAITRDARLVPGAGATEIQLGERIIGYGEKTPGLPQYAIKKFGEAFEVVPRTLAESAGLEATEVLSRLYTAHHKRGDEWTTGVDLENDDGTGVLDAREEGILDLMISKSWAIKLATEAVRTILSVDQIIVARQAGGPKPPGPNPGWDNDD